MIRALFAAVFGLLLLAEPAAAADPWKTYVNTEYGFSVEFPGPVTAQDLPPGADPSVTNRLFFTGNDVNSYGVSVIGLPEGYSFDLVKGAEGVVSANKGTAISSEDLTVQGYPARKVKYRAVSDGHEVSAWVLIVSTPRRVYSVLTAQFGAPNQAESDRVMNSLKLLN